MADRKGSSPGKEKREQSSDRPFFVALGILGGIYVFLIVAMLLADVAYLAMDRRVKIADIDFQLDDSGRLIQHGDRISNQYDRLGLTITSHSPDNPPTIFEYVPQVEGTEPARLLAPVLGIGPAEKLDPAAPGPTEYLPGSLVFQWADPVELTMVDLAHLPAAPGMTLTLLNAEGKTLQVRQFDEIESQASLTVQIGDTPSAGITNVLKLVIDMPRGGVRGTGEVFLDWPPARALGKGPPFPLPSCLQPAYRGTQQAGDPLLDQAQPDLLHDHCVYLPLGGHPDRLPVVPLPVPRT
jgi:hypothetical protein